MRDESIVIMPEIEAPTNPFPGLRPFEFDESHLFFGRDGQSEQLLRKLSSTRFVAVVGTSGSGKSSLVRAGLLPDLFGGFISSAGSNWRVAIMRPSNDPLGNLASALSAESVFGSETKENAQLQATIIEATLRRGSLGLVEVARQHRMPANENLLVVVDQFEELFRFARVTRDDIYNYEAASFVKLLLEAARQRELAIYVVLTMRSDFLGDCSLFWELPEAINEGQYLIPRLTRDQRREAVTGPVAVCGGEMTERLVNRLLNDMGDDPDQLPILQHALMRTWNKWKEEGGQGAIDLNHYEAIGEMAQALSRHADEAYEELKDERSRVIAEKIFKGLTEKGADNREIRRPVVLKELCALADANPAEVKAVIEVFRREGRTFLMPPAPVALDEESLIDISHESLIRNWQRLKGWVDEEALSAQIYRRLAETAELYERGEAGLWRDPDLQIALNWREENHPSEVWAKRYHIGFDVAMNFLDASVAARGAELVEAERRRQRELRRARLTAVIFAIAFLFALAATAYAFNQRNVAQEQRNIAQEQSAFAKQALGDAQKAREDALQQKEIAVTEARNAAFQAQRAEEASDKATAEKDNAEKQKKIAEEQRSEAQHAKSKAEVQARIAEENRAKAELAKKEAEEQRNLAVTAGEKNRQLLYAADLNLAQQAYEANSIERGRELLSAHTPESDKIVSNAQNSIDYLAGFEWYYLWRLYNSELKTVQSLESVTKSVAFSADGTRLATGNSRGLVMLWDTNLNQELTSMRLTGEVKSIAFSQNRKWLAVANNAGAVYLYPAASPENPIATLKLPEFLRSDGSLSLSNLAFSPDSKMLALGVSAGKAASNNMEHLVLLWNTDSWQLRATLKGHTSFINSIAFSVDSKALITGSSDNSVIAWNTDSGSVYGGVTADSYVLSVANSSDDQTFAFGLQDGTIKLLEESKQQQNSLNLTFTNLDSSTQQKSPVVCLSFSPDGRILAAGRADGTVQLWVKAESDASYQELTTLKGHTRAVTSLAFSPDGRSLVSTSEDETVKLWDTGPQIFKLLPITGTSPVTKMALSPDGRILAVGDTDRALKLCDVVTRQPCRTLGAGLPEITSLAFSPDGRILAAGGGDKNIRLWMLDSSDMKEPLILAGGDRVNAVAFSPTRKLLATAGRDKTVKLWDITSPHQIKLVQSYLLGQSVLSVAFSPDGQKLAASGGLGSMALWNIDSNDTSLEPLIRLPRLDYHITSIAFSPDSQMVAAGNGNGNAKLWRIVYGQRVGGRPALVELATFTGHADAVHTVAFSPDGKTLATGSSDKSIKLWSVTSYKELLTLKGHTNSVMSVLFAPDGRWLASGSYDNTVRFWYAATVDDYLNRPRVRK